MLDDEAVRILFTLTGLRSRAEHLERRTREYSQFFDSARSVSVASLGETPLPTSGLDSWD